MLFAAAAAYTLVWYRNNSKSTDYGRLRFLGINMSENSVIHSRYSESLTNKQKLYFTEHRSLFLFAEYNNNCRLLCI